MNVDNLDRDFNFPGLREMVLEYSPCLEVNTVHVNDFVDSLRAGLDSEGMLRLYFTSISQLQDSKDKQALHSVIEVINKISPMAQSAGINNTFKEKLLTMDDHRIVSSTASYSRKRKFDSISSDSMSSGKMNDIIEAPNSSE